MASVLFGNFMVVPTPYISKTTRIVRRIFSAGVKLHIEARNPKKVDVDCLVFTVEDQHLSNPDHLSATSKYGNLRAFCKIITIDKEKLNLKISC